MKHDIKHRAIPDENAENIFGVVQSRGCPALRYAAAGIYTAAGEEVSIATDSIDAASGRLEGEDGGILIV